VQLLNDDPSERVRRSAAYALGAFGPQAAGATEHLIKALGDDNPSVRQNAAWALGQMGEAAGESVSKLCECLRDKDTLVRRDAAGALGALGKAGAKAGRSLIAVVKKRALASLVPIAGSELADSAKDLVPLLEDKDPKNRLDTAIILAQIGGEESGNAVSVLKSALKDPEPDIQEQATAALATLGPLAKPAMYDLADILTDAKNTVAVRRNAALAIAHIGAEAKPVVPSLAKALQGGQPQQVRRYAAEALQRMKYPANEKGIPAILHAIENDTDGYVRTRCIEALFEMAQPEFKESGAQKLLTKVLNERRSDMRLVRYSAARKLATLLQEDAPDKTADVLLEWLTDKEVVIYNRTDARVEGTGTEATVGRANVQQNLGSDARFMAAQALAWLGDKAAKRRDVVQALRKAAKEEDANLRKHAKDALANLGIKE
jgi:HEAT repeat protein